MDDKILVFGDTENPMGLLGCVRAILHPPKHNVQYLLDNGDVEFTLERVKTVIIAVDTTTGADAIVNGEFTNIKRVETILSVLANAKFNGNVMVISPLPVGVIEIRDCPFQLATVAFDVPTVIPTPGNIKDAKRVIVGSESDTGEWVKTLLLTSYIRKCWVIYVSTSETGLYLSMVSVAKVGNAAIHRGIRDMIAAAQSPSPSPVEDFLELVFDHGGILPHREVKLVP